jgi:hypothetical protein
LNSALIGGVCAPLKLPLQAMYHGQLASRRGHASTADLRHKRAAR